MSDELGCLVVLVLIVAFVGLGLAVYALRRAAVLRGEIADLRQELAMLRRDRRESPAPRPSAAVASEVPAAAAAHAAPVAAAASGAPAGVAPAGAPLGTPPSPSPPVVEPKPTPSAAASAAPSPPLPPPLPPRAPVPAAVAEPSLEERLGARLPVWLGAAALALAGIFLVKYSFDRGLLSPAVRIALGIAFGIGLLTGGELLRRRDGRVSQALSAAGIADLYAALLAATSLYHLLSPSTGFALMALNTAVAVALALRQGPMVAIVGLVGGFLTPALIRSDHPRAGALFAYLLLLQAGLLAVTRRRSWSWLGMLAVGAGLLWVLIWLGGPFERGDVVWIGLFLVLSVASGMTAAFAGRTSEGWSQERASRQLVAMALGGSVLVMAAVTGVAGFGTLEWVFFGLLALGAIVLGRRDSDLELVAWLAIATSAVLFAAWATRLEAAQFATFLWTALGLGGVLVGAAYVAHFGAESPQRWASASAILAVAFLLICYGAGSRLEVAFPWGAVAVALAGVSVAAAVPAARRRRTLPGLEPTLAAFAVAATTCLSLAVPMELEREWLTVAWALEVLALVWLEARLKLPVLHVLAAIVAAGVGARLLLNPLVLSYPIGETPVVNWLLYGYGVPALALIVAAVLADRRGAHALSEGLRGLGLALGAALVTLEIRQYFHPASLSTPQFFLTEWGTLAIAWFGMAAGLFVAARRWPPQTLAWGGRLAAAVGLAISVLALGLAANPLWAHHPVGERMLANRLLWVYGLPVALVAWLARELVRRGERVAGLCAGVATLLGALLLLTLELRQAFHGDYLDQGAATGAENYAYSVAAILFGTALLVAGIVRRGRFLRYAALAVMLLAVCKVFLYDMSELHDLYRVFSFLGLGASLLLLAFLYQRFVVREGVS